MSRSLKIFCLVLCLCMVLALAVSLTACKKDTPAEEPAGETPASQDKPADGGEEEPLISGHTHVFDKQVATALYKASDATCLQKAKYYFSCECGEKGTATFEAGELAAHRYKNGACEVCMQLEDHVHTLTHHAPVAKTCTTPGNIEYWSCTCNTYFSDEAGEHEIALADTVIPASHTLSTATVNEATCTEKGLKRTTCADCDYQNEVEISAKGHAWDHDRTCTQGRSCTVCTATEPALGHDYADSVTAPTCTEQGFTTHTCTRCPDTYVDTYVPADGHVVPEEGEGAYTLTSAENKQEADLCRVLHYTGTCSVCHQPVNKDTNITEHHFTKTITKHATCREDGEYTYTCNDCGYQKTEAFSDANAHKWDSGETVGSVTTYHCQNDGCTATKTAIVANTQAEMTNADLQATDEIKLEAATIQLDDDTKDALGENVKISANVADEEAVNALGLSEEDAAAIAGKKVYEFGAVSDGNEINAGNKFGGKVTVRIPYELADDEDPDSIVVFWIDGDRLVAQEATWENGYAVFETDHFSYYTVTRMSPADRCALYHNHETGKTLKEIRVDESCTSDGYVTVVCTCCGEVVSREFLAATGHNYETEITANATCTAAGTLKHTCANCGHSYNTVIAALGHDWQETERVGASCTAAGHIIYTCQNDDCGETYTVTLMQKNHNFAEEVTAPTCTLGGYTTYTCPDCGYTYKGNEKAALGHKYEEIVHAPTCTEDGYTEHACVRCDASYTSNPTKGGHTWNLDEPTCAEAKVCLVCGTVGAPATGNHTMVNGVCSVCGQGCAHTFAENRVEPACTERGYLAKVCTKCGVVEKSEYTDALGHDGDFYCTRCHASTLPQNYFGSLAASLMSGKMAIRFNNVTVVPVKGLDVAVDFAELAISLNEEGQLTGFGSGEVRMIVKEEVKTFAAKAYLANGKIYIFFDGDTPEFDLEDVFTPDEQQEGGEQEVEYTYITDLVLNSAKSGSTQTTHVFYAEMDLAALLADTGIKGIGEYADMANEMLPLFVSEIVPMLTDLMTADKGTYTNVDMMLANYLFTLERKNGKATLTLDFEKLAALNDLLATKTLAEIAADLYGEGAYDKFCNDLMTAVSTMSIGETIEMLKGYGFDMDAIAEIADEIAPMITGKAGDDPLGMGMTFAEMLKNEQFLAMPLSTLLSQGEEENFAQQLAAMQGMYTSLKTMTVYDLAEQMIAMMGQRSAKEEDHASTAAPEVIPVDADSSAHGEIFAKGLDDGQSNGEPEDREGDGQEQAPVSLHDRVDEMLKQIAEIVEVKLTTKLDGTFLSLNVNVDLPGMASGNIEVVADDATNVDYAAMVAEVNARVAYFDRESNHDLIVKAIIDYLADRYDLVSAPVYDEENDTVTYTVFDHFRREDEYYGQGKYGYGEGTPFAFNGGYYYVQQKATVTYTVDPTTPFSTLVVDDCVDAVMVQLLFSAHGVEGETAVIYTFGQYGLVEVEDPSAELLAAAAEADGQNSEGGYNGEQGNGEKPIDEGPIDEGPIDEKPDSDKPVYVDDGGAENGEDGRIPTRGIGEDGQYVEDDEGYDEDDEGYDEDDDPYYGGEGQQGDYPYGEYENEEEDKERTDTIPVIFLVSTATGSASIVPDTDPLDNAYTCHQYEFAYIKSAAHCEEYSQYHYYCTVCGKEYVKNAKIGHRDLEIETEYVNGENCSDGVYLTARCKTCGEVLADHLFFEEGVDVPTVLSFPEYDDVICPGHLLMTYDCSDHCGQYSSGFKTNYNFRYEYVDGIGQLRYCPDCGLVIFDDSNSKYEYAGCLTFRCHDTIVMLVKGIVLDEDTDWESVLASEENYTLLGTYENREFSNYNHDYKMHSGYFENADSTVKVNYSICAVCGHAEIYLETVTETSPCVYHYTTTTIEGSFDIEHIPTNVETLNDLTGSVYFTEEERDSYESDRTEHPDDQLMVESVVFTSGVQDCNRGAIVTLRCAKCGATEERRVEWHKTFFKNSFDLANYGAVCDGTISYYECACGKHSEVRVDSDCDLDWYRYISAENTQLYVDGCAVTDPDACGLVIARKRAPRIEGCYEYRDLVWMIGYDEETGTAALTLNEKSEWSYANYHRYVNVGSPVEEEWGCSVYSVQQRVCTICGATTEDSTLLRENHNWVTDPKDPCRSYCTKCGWSQDHHRYTSTTIPATCSQPGLYKEYCTVCGNALSEREIEPGHRYEWNKDVGKYVCRVCGLESANGWDGTVILEHCKKLSEGTTVVVGYYVRDDQWDNFFPVVTLVLDPDKVEGNDQIALTNVMFAYSGEDATDDTSATHYVSFDLEDVLAEVQALFEEDGQLAEYDVSVIEGLRLSFVPYGGGSTLDYAITFTSADLMAMVPAE